MDDKQLEEKLQLLDKSYHRMPQHLDVDALMQKIDEEENANAQPVINKQPKKMWVWGLGAAAMFIGGVLVSPYILEQESESVIETRSVEMDTGQTEQAEPLDVVEYYGSEADMPLLPNNDEVMERLTVYQQTLRADVQQELGLNDEELNAVPYIVSADKAFAQALSEMEKYDFIFRDEDSIFLDYATPAMLAERGKEAAGLSFGDEISVTIIEFMMTRLEQLTATYTSRTNNDAAVLARQGLYEDGSTINFRYDEFAERYRASLAQFGGFQGLLAFAEFQEPLYIADDIRYAPEDILAYYSEMTNALLYFSSNRAELNMRVDVYDAFELEYVIAITRMLKGTTDYPLNQRVLQKLIDAEPPIFAEIAATISEELQRGVTTTADALTYEDIEAIIAKHQQPKPHVLENSGSWSSGVTNYFKSQDVQTWENYSIDQINALSDLAIILYYVYAQENNQKDMVAYLHNGQEFTLPIDTSAVIGIDYIVSEEEQMKANIQTADGKASVMFEKIDGAWRRTE